MLSKSDYDLVQADLRKNRADPKPPKPGLIHRARTLLSLAPTNYFGTHPVFIDLNTIHQKVNWAALKNRPIAGYMDKCGEVDDTAGPDSWMNPNFSGSVQGAADAGAGFVGFLFSHCGAWWLNSQYTQQGVSDIFDKASPATDTQRMKNLLMQNKEFALIVRQWAIGDGWTTDPEWLKTAHFRRVQKWVIDIERWWRSYTEYLDYLRGNRTISQVKVIDPPWISFSVKDLQERLIWAMSHGYLPAADIEIVDYSGKWFINQYSPSDLGTFLQTKSTWPAIWYWGAGSVATTIEDLINTQLASIPDSWRDTTSFKNAMFGQTIRWVQISGDRFTIPEITDNNGKPTAFDVNVYVAPDDYKTWLGITGTPPPPPPDTNPDLTALTARVKALEDAAPLQDARIKALEDLRDRIKNSF